MTLHPSLMHRRTLLKFAAVGLVTGPLAAAGAAQPNPVPPGRPGEFDFLSGNWRIAHRRRPAAGKTEWDEFPGEATCWSILGGVASIEELRIPARNFSGMGIRLLDVEKKIWSDFWVNAKSGVLMTPGTTGGFVNGVGIFDAQDTDGDTPVIIRGMWDRITPTSCRWTQAVSRDNGKTWDLDWEMAWTRA